MAGGQGAPGSNPGSPTMRSSRLLANSIQRTWLPMGADLAARGNLAGKAGAKWGWGVACHLRRWSGWQA